MLVGVNGRTAYIRSLEAFSKSFKKQLSLSIMLTNAFFFHDFARHVAVLCALSVSLAVFDVHRAKHRCKMSVDIVMTVHDSLPVVKEGIKSLEASELQGSSQYSICATVYLMDANSSSSTSSFLASKVGKSTTALEYRYLWLNSSSYTQAVNKGIAAGVADTVIVSNSDVIVPYSWASDLRAALRAYPHVGMVSPLSNSACYQSVPSITPHRWTQNTPPSKLSVQEINDFLKQNHDTIFPPVPLLNGFLFALRRDLLDAVGYFDEIKFPLGYGEENEFALRIRKAGYSLHVADNLYVHHKKSASFGREQRLRLIRDADAAYSQELRRYIKFAHQELATSSSLAQIREVTSMLFNATD